MTAEDLEITDNYVKALVICLAEDKHLFVMTEYLDYAGSTLTYVVRVDDNRNVINLVYLSKIHIWAGDDLVNQWLACHFLCDAPRRVRPIYQKNSHRARDWYILSKEGKELVREELTLANVWPYPHLTKGAGVLTVKRLERMGLLWMRTD